MPETVELKRQLIEPGHPELSLRRQCELIDLNRSVWYYQPADESEYNLQLMRLIDEQYTETPFYGWPRMTAQLRRQGHQVNAKRVRRQMQLMGLQAIYPKPKTTIAGPDHKVYPYLLRNLPISRCNQVWSADITYIRMTRGFMYLVAILDWFSRCVLAWQFSNTLWVATSGSATTSGCAKALAIARRQRSTMRLECLGYGKVGNPSPTTGFLLFHSPYDDGYFRYVYHVRIDDSWP